jgi:hypothetical protein
VPSSSGSEFSETHEISLIRTYSVSGNFITGKYISWDIIERRIAPPASKISAKSYKNLWLSVSQTEFPLVKFWKVQMFLSMPPMHMGQQRYVQLHWFLTAERPSRLTVGEKTPDTHRTCDCVGPTAALKLWWKLSCSCRESNTGLYRPTTPAGRTATTAYQFY